MKQIVCSNKLYLNLSKNNFMLFTTCRREQNVNISINNCDMVYKTKLLGVVTDSKLNRKDNFAMVKSKMSKSIGINLMHKAKHLLDRRSGIILHFPCFFHTSPIVVNCGGHVQFKHKKMCIYCKKSYTNLV